MRLEVLMSTMHLDSTQGLIDRSGLSGDAVVVNQCEGPEQVIEHSNDPRVIRVDSTDVGLSRSRNLALATASADVCLLADDDEVFVSTYEDRVLSTFADRPYDDVIAFTVNFRESLRKPPLRARSVRRLDLMKLSSVQLAFRRDRVLESGVRFDCEFGAGSTFNMGEEFIFLSDLARRGLRIAAVPLEIAHLEERTSTWFTDYDDGFFRARGASFARAQPTLAPLLVTQWALRKRSLFAESSRSSDALRLMLRGVSEWRNGRG